MSASKDNHLSQVRMPDGSFGPMADEVDDVDSLAEEAEKKIRQRLKPSEDFDADLAFAFSHIGIPPSRCNFPSSTAKWIHKYGTDDKKAFMALMIRYQDKIAEKERSEKALKDDMRRQMKYIESLQITNLKHLYDNMMEAVEWWYRTHDADMEKPDWLRNAEELAV